MAKIIATAQRRNSGNQRNLTQKERQEVEKLAYQFFVERSYQHGYDHHDWLRAETIVRSRRS